VSLTDIEIVLKIALFTRVDWVHGGAHGTELEEIETEGLIFRRVDGLSSLLK
jgi:hypothetical protein